jgi:hypothetical protein
MERDQPLRLQGAEAEQPQRTQLAPEAPRRDVDSLLTGLQLSGKTVVDKGHVGARAEAPPFAGAGQLPRPSPELEVAGGQQQAAGAQRRRPDRPPQRTACEAPQEPGSPRRVEPGAELHAGQEGGVGAGQLHRGAAAGAAELEQGGERGHDHGIAPAQLDTSITQPDRDRLGQCRARGQSLAGSRKRVLIRRGFSDHAREGCTSGTQGRHRLETLPEQGSEPGAGRTRERAQQAGIAHRTPRTSR